MQRNNERRAITVLEQRSGKKNGEFVVGRQGKLPRNHTENLYFFGAESTAEFRRRAGASRQARMERLRGGTTGNIATPLASVAPLTSTHSP